MRVTVIFDDSTVYVDGVARHVDMPPHDPNLRAIQWYGEHGDAEVRVGAGFLFRDFDKMDVFIKAWEKAAPIPVSSAVTPGQSATGVEEM
jgi:hypothetical protein